MSEQQQPLKGTTTVGIVYKDGVVLAADKRASAGTFIAARDVEKIHMISPKMALTMAGGVGDAQTLTRFIKSELELYKHSKGDYITVKGAATLLANVLQGSKFFPYFVQLIIAGYDEKPRLFDLDLTGGLLEEKYVSTGSGSVVAIGLLDEFYKDGMTEDEAVKLAIKAVSAAMKRDTATGEGIDVIVISADKARKFNASEVKEMVGANTAAKQAQ
jgi:proteasome beta subunit